MSISQVLSDATKLLSSISQTSRLDAELLLARVLDVSRSYFYAHPERVLTSSEQNAFENLLQERSGGKPMAYILGEQEFFSLSLKITEDVLIPRPETEVLVEAVLKSLPEDQKLKIIDLGTGSGAIAVALAKMRPNWQVLALDVSSKALSVAKSNAERSQIHNVSFLESNWLEAVLDADYDAIISNPPYVCNNDPDLAEEVLRFEPHLALFAGQDGLGAIRVILKTARTKLKPAGMLFLEHGARQGDAVKFLFSDNNYIDVNQERDTAGFLRVTLGKS
ncbi:MAG: peptide chain release factor N(5)-glutamine methyltransferase [Gammaproteobacteria bacterium]